MKNEKKQNGSKKKKVIRSGGSSAAAAAAAVVVSESRSNFRSFRGTSGQGVVGRYRGKKDGSV